MLGVLKHQSEVPSPVVPSSTKEQNLAEEWLEYYSLAFLLVALFDTDLKRAIILKDLSSLQKGSIFLIKKRKALILML